MVSKAVELRSVLEFTQEVRNSLSCQESHGRCQFLTSYYITKHSVVLFTTGGVCP